jgi:RNA polymerase-binding transcription factor DksA
MLSKTFVEEMKAALLAEKERLTGELSGLLEHTELGQDYDDNAQEVELDDVNKGVRARVEADLEKIDKALAKIEAGTYGTDDDGQAISEDRLRAIPWADQAI